LVKIRLRRMGRKKLPIYKIVAADARSPRDGRVIESLGTYDPNNKPSKIEFKEGRVLYWLKSGAQPTVTVRNLLTRKGLLLRLHLMKKGADDEKITQELSKWSATQENKLKRTSEKRLLRKDRKKKAAKKGEQPETAAADTATPAK